MTKIYTHIVQKQLGKIINPIDRGVINTKAK